MDSNGLIVLQTLPWLNCINFTFSFYWKINCHDNQFLTFCTGIDKRHTFGVGKRPSVTSTIAVFPSRPQGGISDGAKRNGGGGKNRSFLLFPLACETEEEEEIPWSSPLPAGDPRRILPLFGHLLNSACGNSGVCVCVPAQCFGGRSSIGRKR